MKTTAAFAAACLLCMNAMADELDLSFNEDAFRAFYVHDLSSNDLAWDAGLLNNSDKGFVGYGSLYLTGFASDGLNPIQAGLGGRTGWVDGDDSGQNGIPVALGGFLKYTLKNFNRFALRVDAYYAPDALTIKDLESYKDYSIRFSYGLLKTAELYIGARYVKGEFDNDTSSTFDSGMHAGLNLKF